MIIMETKLQIQKYSFGVLIDSKDKDMGTGEKEDFLV